MNSVDQYTVTNCTFAENVGIGHNGGSGGAMYNSDSSPTVTNCVLWDNSPDTFSGPGAPIVSFSDVEGGYDGEGNIEADPLFVDPDAGNYHLSVASPCIDAADNTAVPKGITSDLDGNPRFVDDPCTTDTGNSDGTNPLVDMGAYEFQVSCPWDLECDGTVGITDFLELLSVWGTDPDGPPDFDGDGTVGITDFLTLLGNWGPCP